MPKSRGRKKPKKARPGRGPRPGRGSGPSMRMGLDAVTHGIVSAPPLLAPVFALVTTWMWNAAEDRSPAGSCVDSGIIFTTALALYGIEARLEPVKVTRPPASAMRPCVPGPEGAESTDGHGRRGGSGVPTARRSGLLTVLLSVWLLTWRFRVPARCRRLA